MLHEKYAEYFIEGCDSVLLILKDYKSYFEKLKEVQKGLINNKYDNIGTQKEALQILGAVNLALKPIYTYANFLAYETQDNALVSHHDEYLKNPYHVKTENAKGEKVDKLMAYSSTVGKSYSAKFASQYRRVASFLKGYVDSSETNIMVLQSLIKTNAIEGNFYGHQSTEKTTSHVVEEDTYVLDDNDKEENDEDEL